MEVICPAVSWPVSGMAELEGWGEEQAMPQWLPAKLSQSCRKGTTASSPPHYRPLPLPSPPPEAFLAPSLRVQPTGLQPRQHLAGEWRQGESWLPGKPWSRQIPRRQRPVQLASPGAFSRVGWAVQAHELPLEERWTYRLTLGVGTGFRLCLLSVQLSSVFPGPRRSRAQEIKVQELFSNLMHVKL